MKSDFLLNDRALAYLIHGQSLCLKYQREGYWFVFVAYENGESFFRKLRFRKFRFKKLRFKKWRFRKLVGVFESVTNKYSPFITMWGEGCGIKKLFHKQLRINFFNTHNQIICSHTPKLPAMPQFHVESPSIEFHPQPVKVRTTVQPRLVANEINRKAYDAYSAYKTNHPSTSTIN